MENSRHKALDNPLPPTTSIDQPAPQISYETFLNQNTEIGYLKVQASRARQSLPISQVMITVMQDFGQERVLFFRGETDANGIIDHIELPAPPRDGSLNPQSPQRGAFYQVFATHPEFKPQRYSIEMFSDVTAILPVNLHLAEEG